jgi:hypothetical protein
LRDVFYLIRGRKKKNVKVVLIHGSFFETIDKNSLISQSFEQVLEEILKEKGLKLNMHIKNSFIDIFSKQENFSKVRNIEKASVKLRFRIMTEVKPEGNILNSQKYPEIRDNTINLVVPKHNEQDQHQQPALEKFLLVYSQDYTIKHFAIFNIKHYRDGYFTVFQTSLQNSLHINTF